MIIIRNERPGDEDAIRAIHTAAFEGNEAALVDTLRAHNKNIVAFVAIIEEQIVGHVLFTEINMEPETSYRGVGLAPMAVLPDFQRQGIGSALIRAGLQLCARKGYDFTVVLGHLDYYPRFGFQRASAFGLGNTYNADEHFMAVELRPDVLGHFAGVVHYQPEFDEVGV
jgi:putative acetyltransferase